MKHVILIILSITFFKTSIHGQGVYFMCDTPTVITDPYGTIFDSGGPSSEYLVDENCTLLISSGMSSLITLSFQQFATESGWDFLAVYDGTDTSGTLLLNHSGNSIPSMITATSGSLLLIWNSDFTIIDSGFQCSWNTIACPCDTISGTVYNDLNSNCIYDSGEELNNIPIAIYDSSSFAFTTFTDVNGYYSIYAPVSLNYDMQVNSGFGFNTRFFPSCPSTGILTIDSLPSVNNNFALSCEPGFDFTGNLTTWALRPGFENDICVSIRNEKCNSPSGQVEIVVDSIITILPDTAGIGYTVLNNTITFPLNPPDLEWQFCIPVIVSQFAQLGDTVCFTMNITPVTGDSAPANNTVEYCFPIRTSYDPNDKNVIPSGIGTEGFVLPNTDLTYTVRFQNTGNIDAVNIYILDTLSQYLDINSFELVAASHDVTYSLYGNNILRFDFANIHLPDSNANESLSHGYVTYRLKMIPIIPNLAEIRNTAAIYFDFNPPIITNTIVNTVDQFLSNSISPKRNSSVSIYPNPANNSAIVIFNDKSERKIQIIDVHGKSIYSVNIKDDSPKFPLGNFANGVYMVLIFEAGRLTHSSRLIVSH